MADDPVLKDFGVDPQGRNEVEEEEEEEEASIEKRARKKARMSPLHIHRFAPLSFLSDAVEETDGSFNVTAVGHPFGKNKKAHARKCYEELVNDIFNCREDFREQTALVWAANLFVMGSSSGIGKSTFLAYFIVHLRGHFTNIAMCYAPKAAKTVHGTLRTEEVICVV